MNLTRRHVFLAIIVALSAFLLVQAGTAEQTQETVRSDTGEKYPGATLVSVQDYKFDGRLVEVGENGSINWEYSPDNSRVFDSEYLDNGNVMVSVATKHGASDCPPQQLKHAPNACVENRVLELDGDALRNNETHVVWEYSWYDSFVTHHEVHDADRLPSGETAIIDMGNNRAFTVDKSGSITWEWNASKHLGDRSEFDSKYDSPTRQGEESDWTHMNDIDKLSNGNFQLSIRNFNVVIEVKPETGAIIDVIGRPNAPEIMSRQHNPHRLEQWGTIIIADSHNDRVIEYDLASGEPVWKYGGSEKLDWPRDADRLPNGNTLITDSLNHRVIEVNKSGDVVWEFSGVRLPYEADRRGVPEETGGSVPGWRLESNTTDAGATLSVIQTIEGWASYVFPAWVRFPELLSFAGIIVSVLALGIDWLLFLKRREKD